MKKFKDVIKKQRDHIEFLRTEGKDLVYDDVTGNVFRASEEVYKKYVECASTVSPLRVPNISRGIDIDRVISAECSDNYGEKALTAIMSYKGKLKLVQMKTLDDIIIQAGANRRKLAGSLRTIGANIWEDIR